MIVELVNSGIKAKQVSEDYALNTSIIRRQRREYATQSGDFSKKEGIIS